MDLRTGLGYDIHRFKEGDYITLGGVRLPHDRGIEAHSDGDVVLHALTDALLGTLSLGDIGDHFPPSNDQWKSASSKIFVKHAHNLISDKGYKIFNVDIALIAEAPKIAPFRNEIQQSIATILDITIDRVGFKATTNEKLGAFGRKEGIGALVSVLIGKL